MVSRFGKLAALQRIMGLRRRLKPARWKQVPSHVKQADPPPTVELFSQPPVLEIARATTVRQESGWRGLWRIGTTTVFKHAFNAWLKVVEKEILLQPRQARRRMPTVIW